MTSPVPYTLAVVHILSTSWTPALESIILKGFLPSGWAFVPNCPCFCPSLTLLHWYWWVEPSNSSKLRPHESQWAFRSFWFHVAWINYFLMQTHLLLPVTTTLEMRIFLSLAIMSLKNLSQGWLKIIDLSSFELLCKEWIKVTYIIHSLIKGNIVDFYIHYLKGKLRPSLPS
jgi:hypothetical protein